MDRVEWLWAGGLTARSVTVTARLVPVERRPGEPVRDRILRYADVLAGGLTPAEATANLDADAFDAQCQHLVVSLTTTAEVVGTYRMQIFDGRSTGMHWQRHKSGA